MKKSDVILLCIIAVICNVEFFTKVRDDEYLARSKGVKTDISVIIIEEPDNRGDNTRVLVKTVSHNSKILLTVRTAELLQYGDELKLGGTYDHPKVIDNADGTSFDYPAYLSGQGIYYVMKNPAVEIVAHHRGNWFKEKLLDFKHQFIGKINSALPEPYSLLASGLIVAGKGALSADLQDQFKRAGVIHIVVLSGSNVTIVAEAIMKILSSLPKVVGAGAGILGIIGFTVVAGASATVVRSAIMSIIAIIGTAADKQYNAFRALIVAACLMMIQNPDILFFDPSFQLSFAATLSLMFLGKPVERRLMKITDRFGLRRAISCTIATQIGVTPLILHLSGVFSVVALPVNVLILPFVPFTMLFAFIVGSLSFISLIIAAPFTLVSYILLRYELTVVDIFSSWSISAISSKPISWLAVFGIYAIYAAIYLYLNVHPKQNRTRVLSL